MTMAVSVTTVVAMVMICGCYGLRYETESHYYYVPDNQQVIYDVDLEEPHTVHKRSADNRLRIHLHFDSSINNLPYQQQNLIKEKVWEAVAFWEDTLMVRRTNVPVHLNRRCMSNSLHYLRGKRYCVDGCSQLTMCGDVRVPESHLHSCAVYSSVSNKYSSPPDDQPGVSNTDYVLYVAAMTSDKCLYSKTVAHAAYCQLESSLDRPIAGYFSLCPQSLSTSIHKHEELLYTIKHEMLHALGFTAGLYAFYRDPQGQPLTERDIYTNKPKVFNQRLTMYQWSELVVKQFVRRDWRLKGQTIQKRVNMIVTPNVLREVRNHFNCPSLEGAELEDQGLNGTVYTHWEKRVFENEFMTGTYTQNPIISRISLALMEDTGWYRVQYSNAGRLEWGQNLGCEFVQKSCYEWIETRLNRNADIHPYCIHANRGQPVTDCTKNRKAVAICNLSEFQRDLDPQYQYFGSISGVPASDVGRYGGSVALADYCPYLQEFVWKQDEDVLRGSRCALIQNTLEPSQNHLLEKYSPRSKCFNHGSSWRLQRCRNVFTPHSGSGCYEYMCSSRTGLTIYVQGTAYTCHYTGQQLPIYTSDSYWLYMGNITCPSCTEVCQDEGVTCPPDDRNVYTVLRNPTAHVPCNTAISHTRAKYLTYTTLLFNVLFIVSYSDVEIR